MVTKVTMPLHSGPAVAFLRSRLRSRGCPRLRRPFTLSEPFPPARKRRTALRLVMVVSVIEALSGDFLKPLDRIKPHRRVVAVQVGHQLLNGFFVMQPGR